MPHFRGRGGQFSSITGNGKINFFPPSLRLWLLSDKATFSVWLECNQIVEELWKLKNIACDTTFNNKSLDLTVYFSVARHNFPAWRAIISLWKLETISCSAVITTHNLQNKTPELLLLCFLEILMWYNLMTDEFNLGLCMFIVLQTGTRVWNIYLNFGPIGSLYQTQPANQKPAWCDLSVIPTFNTWPAKWLHAGM